MARSFARRALPFVAGAFVVCAIVQVFLAGLGVFDGPAAFVTHREFGYTFGWLTLVILVLAVVGSTPRSLIGLAVLLLVLFALQSVFVVLRGDLPAVAALHPLNGFLILGTAVVITRRAWALRTELTPVAAGVAPSLEVGETSSVRG